MLIFIHKNLHMKNTEYGFFVTIPAKHIAKQHTKEAKVVFLLV